MDVTLRDGTAISIRPIQPRDRDVLVAGFERLSAESRYRRFFAPVTRLSERDLAYLTEVDHRDHEALLAVDPRTGEGIGVARFVRIGPGVAEPAVVVVDAWQGRGVASALLDALAERAQEEGVVRFEAPVLASNREAIGVLERLGPTSTSPDGREVVLKIQLPPAQVRPPSWSQLLREFATGAIEPARTLMGLLVDRRAGQPGDTRSNVIVVGVEGSATTPLLLRAAEAVADASGASVQLVAAHRLLGGDEGALRAAVGEAAAQLRAQGLHAREVLRRGDPALVLADVAQECNARLIVVGAGGAHAGARRILGSVADMVAARSPCSVLIVRERSGGE